MLFVFYVTDTSRSLQESGQVPRCDPAVSVFSKVLLHFAQKYELGRQVRGCLQVPLILSCAAMLDLIYKQQPRHPPTRT
jgi:hypothetical protein